MQGTAAPQPGESSGAQWLYGADTTDPLVFCAYNNGQDGPWMACLFLLGLQVYIYVIYIYVYIYI